MLLSLESRVQKYVKNNTMKRLVDLAKLARLDDLIRRAATGTPEKLAEHLEMSRSSLFEMIAFLKEEMGAPIIYLKCRPSYVYSYIPKFYLGFEQDRIEFGEMTNIYGDFDSDVFETAVEKKISKMKIQIEISDDEFFFDDDIDFNDLYH